MPPGVKDRLRGNAPAVINSRLIRDSVHITDIAITDDSRGGRMYSDRMGKQNQAYLRQVAQQLELHAVTCLMLSHQNIGRIDNLVGLPSLTKLHLDNNVISKIENLEHLTKLKWLDLSFNRISEIEGLSTLAELEDLSLYSNTISVVKGLENLPKLLCLSLGENRVESLDDTARYLHGLKSLRMLTLSGNKVCASKAYKNRLLAFVGDKLRYLDSRLVLPKDIAAAKEEQNEHLVPIREEDERATEDAKLTADDSKESATYAAWNCPVPQKFVIEMQELRPDGPSVRAMLQHDDIKDRVKDVVDKFTEDLLKKAQELAAFMEKQYESRTGDVSGYHATRAWYMERCDASCRETIVAFERKCKEVIPFGLRVQPDPDTYDDEAILQLRESLKALGDHLLESEADQFDAFEALLDQLDDSLNAFRQAAIETITTRFDELRALDKQYHDDIKNKMSAFFDDKARQDNATDMYRGGQDYNRLLDSKEDCMKAIGDLSDLHAKRLDEIEEAMKKHEETACRQALDRSQEDEHKRSRARITEINTYIKRSEEVLNRWETAFDNM